MRRGDDMTPDQLRAWLAERSGPAALATAATRQAERLEQAAADAGDDALRDRARMYRLEAEVHKLAPDAIKGRKFAPGRPEGTIGPVRAWVRNYVKRYPNAKAAQGWAALKARPVKGMKVYESGGTLVVRWIDTAGKPDTSYETFRNIVRDERMRLQKLTG